GLQPPAPQLRKSILGTQLGEFSRVLALLRAGRVWALLWPRHLDFRNYRVFRCLHGQSARSKQPRGSYDSGFLEELWVTAETKCMRTLGAASFMADIRAGCWAWTKRPLRLQCKKTVRGSVFSDLAPVMECVPGVGPN